jgi:hypothetical protein
MKIIELDESKSQSYDLYTALDNLFYLLAERLPNFFLEPVNLDGEIYHLPKYITKLHYDSIDPQTQDLMNELNKQLQ